MRHRPRCGRFPRPVAVCVCGDQRGGAEQPGLSALPNVSVMTAGERDVDIPQALGRLRDAFGVKTVLCEGGPGVYGAFISSEALDEEFSTLSPVLLEGSAEEQRPGLIEGLALAPGNPKRAELLSVRRASGHFFLRSTLSYHRRGRDGHIMVFDEKESAYW